MLGTQEIRWDTQNAFDSVKREASEQFVKNLILDFGFSYEQAAKAAEVSIDFVQKVRADLNKKKK